MSEKLLKKIQCIICGSDTEDFMKKIYSSGTLGTLNFKRCTKCGLVFSDTMYQMSDEEWQKHNKFYHSYWFNNTRNSLEHNPPYLQQALFFKILQKNNLIKNDNWLDYASGVGTLSRLLKEYFNLKLIPYEKYMADSEGVKLLKENPNLKFNVVFSSALFEHIRSIKTIDEMMSLLKEDGVFMVHTLVTENIPKDNNWFYYVPMHCTVFSNKSMQCLMDKYGFKYSIYCPFAKTWAFFRNIPSDIDKIIENINLSFSEKYLYGKNGFMDYWKN